MNKDSKDFQKYLFSALLVPLVIILFFWITNGVFWNLDGNAWATIITGSVGSACTLFLGFVSYGQGKKQRQDYLEKIKELEVKFSELESKINNINTN